MKKSEVKLAEQQREVAEHKLAAVRATTEAKALEHTLSMLESPQPVRVPWSEYPAFDQFGSLTGCRERPYYWTNIDDRTEGRYRPVYETDQDLRMIRADGRRLATLFPVVDSAIESLTDYVVIGFEFKIQARDKTQAAALQPLISCVQKVADKFLERNNFINNLDREIFKQSRSDGESFPTLYPDDGCKDPEVRLELVQPDFILAPAEERPLNNMLRMGHKLNYWYHGVHTQFNTILKREDVSRPLGYHAVFDRTGEQWDYLPASRVEHIKRNVGIDGRRGVPDSFIVTPEVEQEAKLRRNTAMGAAILAAIVEIRQYPEGTSKGTVQNLAGEQATSTYNRQTPNGSQAVNSQNVQPGTVRHTPAGMTSALGPMGQLRSPIYIEVAQFLLRIIGNHYHFPEFMISGDASNNNMASSVTPTEPFQRFCESNQFTYGQHYKNILWKALYMYWKLGRFGACAWQQITDAIDIKVNCKSPAIRDPLQRAQENEILHAAGVKSTHTWQIESGLDTDEEAQQIAKEPKPAPVAIGVGAGNPFGMGQAKKESRIESLAAAALRSLIESK